VFDGERVKPPKSILHLDHEGALSNAGPELRPAVTEFECGVAWSWQLRHGKHAAAIGLSRHAPFGVACFVHLHHQRVGDVASRCLIDKAQAQRRHPAHTFEHHVGSHSGPFVMSNTRVCTGR
jgi:hypothetical protein